MRPVRRAALAVLTAVAVGGCGGGSPGPAEVVRQAIESHSPTRCDLYTDGFFEREAGTSAAAGRSYCRQVASRLPSVHARIAGTAVQGDRAVVTVVASSRTVAYTLVRRKGSWLIDRLGDSSGSG